MRLGETTIYFNWPVFILLVRALALETKKIGNATSQEPPPARILQLPTVRPTAMHLLIALFSPAADEMRHHHHQPFAKDFCKGQTHTVGRQLTFATHFKTKLRHINRLQ